MWRALLLVSVALPAALSSVPDVEKDKGQVWAVLVAGSRAYDNYRHQADVCHAYQILHRNGVPDSNIIVMMYDDIANNPDNPKKGKIFNKPGGPNVYGPKAVPKDYTGDAVTPQNFVHVLTGNHEAVKGVGSGKVLKSGPNDHVFINFVDHGATGLIGFPNDVMHADDLIKALKTMSKQKMYKKLVFYMEACESGSMFDKLLPKNIEIFATTAANPTESSYACYWSNALQTFLGDEYSISWMEDTDTAEKHKKFPTETLLKQYNNVVKRVKDSHPSMYGETSIDKDHVQDFLGKSKQKVTFHSESSSELEAFTDAVPSRDVALHTLTKKIALAETVDQKEELQKKKDDLIKGRKEVDQLLSRILSHVTNVNIEETKNIETSRQEISLEMMPCYKTLVKAFSEKCVNINKDAVPSRDVALHTLTKKIALAETVDQKEELQKKKDDLIKGRKEVDQLLSRILSHVTNVNIEETKNIETSRQEISLEMMPCYKTLVKAFSEKCVNINKNVYTFSHLYKFANLCALQYSASDVLEAFSAECGSLHQGMANVN